MLSPRSEIRRWIRLGHTMQLQRTCTREMGGVNEGVDVHVQFQVKAWPHRVFWPASACIWSVDSTVATYRKTCHDGRLFTVYHYYLLLFICLAASPCLCQEGTLPSESLLCPLGDGDRQSSLPQQIFMPVLMPILCSGLLLQPPWGSFHAMTHSGDHHLVFCNVLPSAANT